MNVRDLIERLEGLPDDASVEVAIRVKGNKVVFRNVECAVTGANAVRERIVLYVDTTS